MCFSSTHVWQMWRTISVAFGNNTGSLPSNPWKAFIWLCKYCVRLEGSHYSGPCPDLITLTAGTWSVNITRQSWRSANQIYSQINQIIWGFYDYKEVLFITVLCCCILANYCHQIGNLASHVLSELPVLSSFHATLPLHLIIIFNDDCITWL